MKRPVNLIFLSILVILLCLSFVVILQYKTKQTELTSYPVGDPFLPVMSFPREHEVYFWFKKQGYSGRTILHFSRYFHYVSIAKEDVYAPYEYRRIDPVAAYEKMIEEHNWIWVAVQANILRKVITVLPDSVWEEMKAPLSRVVTGRMKGARYRIADKGTPRITTTIDNIEFDEPVLLNVDASYFVDENPEDLFRVLKDKKIKCLAAGLSYVEGIPEEATDEARERMKRFERMLRGSIL